MRESKIDVTISDIEEAVPENSLDLSDNEAEIDLFNDTAAILNLLDVRNIMGCPGGTCSVFTRAFPPPPTCTCRDVATEKLSWLFYYTRPFFSQLHMNNSSISLCYRAI